MKAEDVQLGMYVQVRRGFREAPAFVEPTRTSRRRDS
jgi:hypothetical protein